jgi:hypothetical protein
MCTSGETIGVGGTGDQERESMKVSAAEYGALSDIRGLQEKAHWMVMMAKPHSDRSWTLEGDPKAFDELVYDLSEEIELELSPRKNLRHLAKVYHRLRPDDWI